MPKQVRISEVINLLKNGHSRWESDAKEPGMSVEKKLDLTFTECKMLFDHPKLKGIKSRFITLQVIDDTEPGSEVTNVTEDEEIAQPETPVAQPARRSRITAPVLPTTPAEAPRPLEPEPVASPVVEEETPIFD
jgi:hypothetical protein